VIPKPEKCTKSTQNVPNGRKISQSFLKYYKWPQNISTFTHLRPSKIYPNWDFWFENKPSGNPDLNNSTAPCELLTQFKKLPPNTTHLISRVA
jgi:hypothetical protein